MIPLAWGVLAFLTLSTLVTAATVGKPRKPATPGQAACIIAVNLILAALAVWGGRR